MVTLVLLYTTGLPYWSLASTGMLLGKNIDTGTIAATGTTRTPPHWFVLSAPSDLTGTVAAGNRHYRGTTAAARSSYGNKGPRRPYCTPCFFSHVFFVKFVFSTAAILFTVYKWPMKHALRQTANLPNQSLFVPAVYLGRKLTFTPILCVLPDLSK